MPGTREIHIDELAAMRGVPPSAEVEAAETEAADAESDAKPAEATASGLPRASRDSLKAKTVDPEGTEVVDLPEIGLSVKIKALPLSVRTAIEFGTVGEDGAHWGERIVQTIIAGVIEPNLQDDDREWVEGLDDTSAGTLFGAISRLSAIGREAQQEAMASFRRE